MTRLLTLFLLGPVVALAGDAPTAPEIPEGAVLAPQFAIGNDGWYAGTAFAVRYADEHLVLSAHSLLGPAGGYDRQLAPAEAGTVTLTVKDRYTKKKLGFVATGVPVPGAYAFEQDPAGELSAFRVPPPDPTQIVIEDARTTKLRPLELAERCPKKGTPAWLAFDAEGGSARTYAGTVDECDDKHVLLVMKDKPGLAGASGAPFVTADGKVIGLMVVGGEMEGDLIVVGNPAQTIRSLLDAALNASPKPATVPAPPAE